MTRPLVHIGYHKTGSTWLQKRVFENEQMGFLHPIGHMQLEQIIAHPHPLDFDFESVSGIIQGAMREAEARHLTPAFSSERFAGAMFSGGHDSTIIADRLVKLFPNAHILIIIREQKKIIQSFHNQYIKEGGTLSLRRFVQNRNPRLQANFRYEHFMYDRLIRYYQNLFGAESVLVLPFELFEKAPETFVQRIYAFCEMPLPVDTGSLQYDVVNPGLAAATLRFLRMFNSVVTFPASVHVSSPILVSKRTYRWLSVGRYVVPHLVPKRIQDRMKRRDLEQLTQLIKDLYAESNTITEQLSGLDLAAYGYDVAR